MSAQNSLKAIAEAILERTNQRTIPAQSENKAAQYPHIAQNIGYFEIAFIRSFLFKIGEPEKDYDLVLNKCRSDSEALQYFIKHAQGKCVVKKSCDLIINN